MKRDDCPECYDKDKRKEDGGTVSKDEKEIDSYGDWMWRRVKCLIRTLEIMVNNGVTTVEIMLPLSKELADHMATIQSEVADGKR